MNEKGEKQSKVLFKFLFKNTEKSESNKNIFLCVLRLEKGHHTSSPDVTRSWEHSYTELTGSVLY